MSLESLQNMPSCDIPPLVDGYFPPFPQGISFPACQQYAIGTFMFLGIVFILNALLFYIARAFFVASHNRKIRRDIKNIQLIKYVERRWGIDIIKEMEFSILAIGFLINGSTAFMFGWFQWKYL